MAQKDKIYAGDNYPVRYQLRRTNPDEPTDSWGLPQTVVSGIARVFDGNTGTFLPLGGTGVFSVPVTIEPPTGETREDRGSTVSYVVPSTFTQEPGTYTLFITCTMASGVTQTEDRKYIVNEFR